MSATPSIIHAAQSRILVLDGAMGTAIQNMNLTASDFGGAEYEGCNEYLNITRPDAIETVLNGYLEAGADIVETNTFGATRLVLNEYNLGSQMEEINRAAVRIARKAVEKFSSPEKPRFIAGSMGPTTKAISVTGGITFEELVEEFYLQAKILTQERVDYLLLETCQDARNIKAGLLGIDRAFEELGVKVPIAVSGTVENTGTLLAGPSVESLMIALQNRELLYLGLNCATGPEFMTEHIRSLAELSPFRVSCVPNAGLPDEHGCYLESPDMVSEVLERFMQNRWINFIGGCCGTHFGHIRALSQAASRHQPRPLPDREHGVNSHRSYLSGIEFLEITDEVRPVIVGERTNSIGSKKFRECIKAGDFEAASEIAREQVRSGAQIIDVCTANPDRNEIEDMERVLSEVVRKVKVPIMIDSTDDRVIEKSLTYCQGKAIINSINLEDGEERFEKVVPLAKRYGAALVVGTIDEDPEQGMAITRERKLAVARRSYELLTKKYAFPPEDIYFDPLVFPCATGDQQYIGSARETVEGLRLIKKELPHCKTVLGISNVSFGLPAAGREVLNSVFLYHCVQAGLDLAIVNSQKLERFADLTPEEISISERLLFTTNDPADDPIAAFALFFRSRNPTTVREDRRSSLTCHERLQAAIVNGSKEGLIEDLQEALAQPMAPLEIINGPLMAGMDRVGKLFGDNKLIVAEVLQSAEVMKAAVKFLEPYMQKADIASRGKVILATVKGDVHDIGKNLVDIILSNNGYNVINLGIKITSEMLISAIREHKPDIVGLSGLLVKSAQQMVLTVGDMAQVGMRVPVLVGGAALSRNFTENKIRPAYNGGIVLYAVDAMSGLELSHQLMNPETRKNLEALAEQKKKEDAQKALAATVDANAGDSSKTNNASGNGSNGSGATASSVRKLDVLPKAPDYLRHIDEKTPIEEIWPYINPLMLYTRHLGVHASVARNLSGTGLGLRLPAKIEKQLRAEHPREMQIVDTVEQVKKEFLHRPEMKPRAVYKFFPAWADGETLFLEASSLGLGASLSSQPIQFQFTRQNKAERLCLTDYVAQRRDDHDSIALFVVSCGIGVRNTALQLKEQGEYLKSHILQALAIESAEAYAELLHSRLRASWGFADPEHMTMLDRFRAQYRGKRYSFGYPACPRLEDQKILFDLLQPSEIGVELTEGFMMDPEASVSALVFHHPDAKYFGVGGEIT